MATSSSIGPIAHRALASTTITKELSAVKFAHCCRAIGPTISLICFSLRSSIPPQYVDNNSMHGHSDEVVIVVPAAEGTKSDPLLVAGLPEHHSVCIETEDVIDPNSPKTVTESSSKFLSFPPHRKRDDNMQIRTAPKRTFETS